MVTNTTENKDCSDLWVNFTCISSGANPPVYNYLLYGDEDGLSYSESGTWMKKILRGGKVVYNCLAYQLVGNITSTNNITLTVNGKLIENSILSTYVVAQFYPCLKKIWYYSLLLKCSSSYITCTIHRNKGKLENFTKDKNEPRYIWSWHWYKQHVHLHTIEAIVKIFLK